jgi:hypothetical protein
MYFSKSEQSIIETFYKNLSSITEEDILTLVWSEGQIQAKFDTCFDDFNEENEEDEFTSFVLKKIELTGKPPVEITEADFFIINYHNFPIEIICNGKKIN